MLSMQLSNKRRATVREFKGSTLIDLREVSKRTTVMRLWTTTDPS